MKLKPEILIGNGEQSLLKFGGQLVMFGARMPAEAMAIQLQDNTIYEQQGV